MKEEPQAFNQQQHAERVEPSRQRRNRPRVHVNACASFADVIRENGIFNIKCQLCQENCLKEDMDCISNCGHFFCIKCLFKYCTYRINAMEEVKCPQERCPAVLNTAGSVYQRLSDNMKKKHQRNLLWRQTISNPNLRLCPTQECEGVIDSTKPLLKCEQCGVEFCRVCQFPKHEGTCDINFLNRFKNCKQCPSCHILIDKISGCNHVRCFCRHQFCYVCLKKWNATHYQCMQRPEALPVGPEPQYDSCTEHFLSLLPTKMRQDIQANSYCKRFFLGIFLILLFPLILGMALVVTAIGIFSSVMVSPCISSLDPHNECQGWQDCSTFFLVAFFPFIVVYLLIARIIRLVWYFTYISFILLAYYCVVILAFFVKTNRNRREELLIHPI